MVIITFDRHLGFFFLFVKLLQKMLSLGDESNTQDYTFDEDLLQDSIAGKISTIRVFITINTPMSC